VRGFADALLREIVCRIADALKKPGV